MNTEIYDLNRTTQYEWELPATGDMNVPGKLFVDESTANSLMEEAKSGEEWNSLDQIRNVACLPGIQSPVVGMSDIHPGYGFPIGGIGAFDVDEGVVVAGGVGFDINCGVRLMRTPVTVDQLDRSDELAQALYDRIPAGLGSEGEIQLSLEEIDEVLCQGAQFAVDRGYGLQRDLNRVEEHGRIGDVDPENISRRAKQRQFKQVGTLGSGNHYLEIQKVAEIYDEQTAQAFGLNPEQVVISIHTGSRALGHQIGQDYLKKLKQASDKYDIPVKDKELVCAPIDSPEGTRYLTAMHGGINCAFANRQAISGLVRQVWEQTMGVSPEKLETVYEVGHNTAKFETHTVKNEERELLVHRKGSTRAFGPGHEGIPDAYKEVGQPVLVGGTMGTSSFVLRGSPQGMRSTFASGIHGAGRRMSRKKAKSKFWGETVAEELGQEGINIKAHSMPSVAEEAPGAYKEVERVIEAAHSSGITPKVARLEPKIVIKG